MRIVVSVSAQKGVLTKCIEAGFLVAIFLGNFNAPSVFGVQTIQILLNLSCLILRFLQDRLAYVRRCVVAENFAFSGQVFFVQIFASHLRNVGLVEKGLLSFFVRNLLRQLCRNALSAVHRCGTQYGLDTVKLSDGFRKNGGSFVIVNGSRARIHFGFILGGILMRSISL